jgi:quercetin dioxygenase-like cupin family protein
MKFCPALFLLFGSTIALCASATAADYKDVCTVSPKNCKILKEDAQFRVYEYIAKAGDKVPMHSHPAHVIYVLEGGGKTKFMMPDGTSKEIELKPGEAVINPPTVHATEHGSDTRVLIVELKK